MSALFRRMLSTAGPAAGSYEHLLVSKPAPGVSLLTFNRPKALNALNNALIKELNHAIETANKTKDIGAIVITGSERAFAAGADIKYMKDLNFAQAYAGDFISHWSDQISSRKPIIAAVNGYALGGGCEIAMMADIMYAGDKAVFGQPEIKLGTMPGAGGTQRLTRAIGKVRAMELILTGRNFSAQEACDWGLAARVFPAADLVDEAVKTAAEIASNAPLATLACKDAVNQAFESSLSTGVRYERNIFYGLFGSADRKEGMAAFAEKRKADWKGE